MTGEQEPVARGSVVGVGVGGDGRLEQLLTDSTTMLVAVTTQVLMQQVPGRT